MYAIGTSCVFSLWYILRFERLREFYDFCHLMIIFTILQQLIRNIIFRDDNLEKFREKIFVTYTIHIILKATNTIEEVRNEIYRPEH